MSTVGHLLGSWYWKFWAPRNYWCLSTKLIMLIILDCLILSRTVPLIKLHGGCYSLCKNLLMFDAKYWWPKGCYGQVDLNIMFICLHLLLWYPVARVQVTFSW